ncbi:MAG TPA: helix-turn-helix transcriptional regulator [Streptosporangiaceae bacterium]|nr:helix-turn-helix transcriptional regulator [Streptosporangiaceae bacterium]
MTDNDQDLLGILAEQYLDFLSGAQPQPPSLAGLTQAQQREARASWTLLSASWQATADYTPPALHDDPLALALGLVPDPRRRLVGNCLRRARMSRRFKPSQLADQLNERGWDIPTKTIVRWELAGSAEIAPALLAGIAEILHVPAEQLTTTTTGQDPAAKQVQVAAATPRFADLAERWAAISGKPVAAARAALQQLMLMATARRGSHLTAEQWLDVLETFIEAGGQDESQQP